MVEIHCLSVQLPKEVRKVRILLEELRKEGFESLRYRLYKKMSSMIESLTAVDLGKIRFDESFESLPMIFSLKKDELVGCVKMNLMPENEKTLLEIICFSRDEDTLESLVKSVEGALREVGIRKKEIRSDTIAGIQRLNALGGLLDSTRTRMVDGVKKECLAVFLDENTRSKLRTLANPPFLGHFLSQSFLSKNLQFTEEDMQKLTGLDLLQLGYVAYCKKCKSFSREPRVVFSTKKEIEALLGRDAVFCAECGKRLNTRTSDIEKVFSLSDMGRELAQGLWLEAFVKSVVEETVPSKNIRVCVYHGKDEMDIVFLHCDMLTILECKDATIGLNDIYVLTIKAERLKADVVGMISTQRISKDLIGSMREEKRFDFVPIAGSIHEIRRFLRQYLDKLSEEFKNKELQELARLLAPVALRTDTRLDDALISSLAIEARLEKN